MMKLAKRVIILSLALLGLAGLFASCKKAQQGSGGAQGAQPSLDLWSMFTGADGVTFTQMVEAYNATNPTIKVNHQPIEANDLYLRLQLVVASGSGIPDIAVNHVERIPLFQEEGRGVNLAPYIANSPIKQERYNPKAWAMTEFAGGHYGIPLDVH
ncbi:MAG: extracellular solute-binding protein, partial [Treponema sp.]|nr:extracellular solute-binding protein [Treponema sp.]